MLPKSPSHYSEQIAHAINIKKLSCWKNMTKRVELCIYIEQAICDIAG